MRFFFFTLNSVPSLDLRGSPWPAKVDTWGGNGKHLGRKLQVVTVSFHRPCLSSRQGCHKRKGLTEAPRPPRNAFRREMSGSGPPKDRRATQGRRRLVERDVRLRDCVTQATRFLCSGGGAVISSPWSQRVDCPRAPREGAMGATRFLPSWASKFPSISGRAGR